MVPLDSTDGYAGGVTRSAEDAALHLRWLLRLRWGAVAAHLVMLGLLTWLLEDRRALLSGALLLGISAGSNAAVQLGLSRTPMPRWSLVAILLADVGTLTGLLHLTGSAMNPFTALYIVHVALAAVVCDRASAWVVSLAAVAGYGSLFVVGDALAMHDHARMVLHLRGMWVAFAVAAAFVTTFVSRARQALSERELVEQRLRLAEERQTRLAALATLAGGAAHELATPLGTIAVVAGDLELHTVRDAEAARDDAALILAEVRRCKKILEDLSAHAGEALGEAPSPALLNDVVHRALEDVPGADAVRVIADDGARARVPARAVATALRGLIRNARQASDDVVVTVTIHPPRIVIEDAGPGMPPEVLARVGEPFFTTREPGRGMGLGVFLARTLAERLGGSLTFTSAAGRGTRVCWTFSEEAS